MTAQGIKNIIPAIYTALNVSSLTTLLQTYGSAYTIFTGRVVPTNATTPFVHVRAGVSLAEFDTKTTSGWEYEFEVAVIDANTKAESVKTMDAIVDVILTLLDDVNLSVTGANHVVTHCVGMTPAQTSDDLVGTVLRFRTVINN